MTDSNTAEAIAMGETGISDSDAEAIGALFLNEDDGEEENSSTPTESDERTSEEEAKAEASEDDAEADETADDNEDTDEDGEPSETLTAADDMKVILPDGTETTVHELKRGNLREADYTRKTQELSQQRKDVEQLEARSRELEQKFEQEREFMANLLESSLVEQPSLELLEIDQFEYHRQKAIYDNQVEHLQRLQHQKAESEQRQQMAAQQAAQERLAYENKMLAEVMPELSDPANKAAFESDVQNIFANTYGFSKEELAATSDHRFVKVISDAIAYQKLQKAAPKAKAATEGKPPMLKSGSRKSARSRQSKDVVDRINQAAQRGDARSVSDILGDLIG